MEREGGGAGFDCKMPCNLQNICKIFCNNWEKKAKLKSTYILEQVMVSLRRKMQTVPINDINLIFLCKKC